ncbi:MAG: hypothetical protein ACK5WZ_08200 [Pseudobdellovibrionaceae bacterium]
MKYQNLKAKAVKVRDVTPQQTIKMWNLFRLYYDDVNLEMFLNDLSLKTHVIILTRQDEIMGFSTVQLYDSVVDGKTVRVIYSGDTIKSREVWGEKNLNKAFATLLAKDYLLNFGKEYYWFLISKGYKTYLLLTNNFPNSWPRYDRQFEGFQKNLIDHLAMQKFGDSYCPQKNLLVFNEPKGRLKEDAVPLTASDLKSEHIRYFLDRNPAFLQGQELCCLARIDMDLWKFAAKKFLLPKTKKQKIQPQTMDPRGSSTVEAHS